jgi:hypothetical protein
MLKSLSARRLIPASPSFSSRRINPSLSSVASSEDADSRSPALDKKRYTSSARALVDAATYAKSRENAAKFYSVVEELRIQSRASKAVKRTILFKGTRLEFVVPVIYPHDVFRGKWDLWCLSLICYVALFTPMQISFFGNSMTYQNDRGEINIHNWWGIFMIDVIVDCTFLFDILVSFRSGSTLPNGINHFDQWSVAKAYLSVSRCSACLSVSYVSYVTYES